MWARSLIKIRNKKKLKFARFFFLLLVTTESLNLNLQFTTFFFINIFSLCDFATLCEPVEWGKKSETNVQHVFGALLLFAQLNMLFLLFFLHVFFVFLLDSIFALLRAPTSTTMIHLPASSWVSSRWRIFMLFIVGTKVTQRIFGHFRLINFHDNFIS